MGLIIAMCCRVLAALWMVMAAGQIGISIRASQTAVKLSRRLSMSTRIRVQIPWLKLGLRPRRMASRNSSSNSKYQGHKVRKCLWTLQWLAHLDHSLLERCRALATPLSRAPCNHLKLHPPYLHRPSSRPSMPFTTLYNARTVFHTSRRCRRRPVQRMGSTSPLLPLRHMPHRQTQNSFSPDRRCQAASALPYPTGLACTPQRVSIWSVCLPASPIGKTQRLSSVQLT